MCPSDLAISTDNSLIRTVRSSLDPVFRPESIAVIGASRTPGTVGYQVVENLVRHGYRGAVYPVNPKAKAIHSIPAHRSVSAIAGSVDLAVIVVPKELVLDIVDECGEKGVPSVVVITAGFKEVGGVGVERERALVERIRRYGMRLVGPNCMGVLNTSPDVSMNATFAPTMPPRGPVSFMSQSGAMGVTILDYAAEYGIGIHHFVSVGNKPDVSGNDLLEYWEDDPDTHVILMYLENFGNPRRFTRIARRVTRRKPIIVVKAGRSTAGARAASSHTGALAGVDVATDALLAQCGVIRVDTVEELFDLAMAFGGLPLPRDNRVSIVTNAGGPGIIIADACESEGLAIAELTAATQERLRGVFPEEASVRNPVDMIATATPESYRVALDAALGDANIDAAIAAFVPPLGVRQADVAGAIVDAAARHPDKPTLAVLMGREGLPQGRAELQDAGIPAYIFPESAARALAALYRHHLWLERPVGEIPAFPVDRQAVAATLERARTCGKTHLSETDALAVLRAYGIPTLESHLARDANDAAHAAKALGFPVVLKVASPDIVHKSDVGGVRMDLRTADEVRAACAALLERVHGEAPEARIDGVLVQPYAAGGREVVIGVNTDAAFGPILMFGLGGIYVEVLSDVAFRLEPLSDLDARDMVRSIRGYRLLEGVRGEPAADIGAIIDVILRVSQLVGDHDTILELDINPFLVFEHGGIAADAHLALGEPVPARTL